MASMMMSTRSLAQQCSSSCLRARAVPPAKAAVARSSCRAVERRVRRHVVVVRAAEEATATAEQEAASTAEASNGSSTSTEELSPLEQARKALEAEQVDKPQLEAALALLDAEIASLNDAAAAAESRAAVLENTVATAKDQLLRLNADFDNFRRRSATEKEQLAESVRGDVVQQLLPLIDNFELARTQVKAETESEIKINNSYQGLYKQFVDLLRALGIEAVPTTGTPFDPAIHEAIMREPNDEVADGTVLVEFRKGFRLGDKLLRPAMVKVSVNEGGAPTNSSEE